MKSQRCVDMTTIERKAEALKLLRLKRYDANQHRIAALTRYQIHGEYGHLENFSIDRCLKLFDGQRLTIRHSQSHAGIWRWYVLRRGSPDYPTIYASASMLVVALLTLYWRSVDDE